MLSNSITMKFLPFLAFALFASLPARAQLPMLQEKPWIGYFLGFELKKARFGISAKGATLLEPIKRDGSVLATTNPIKLNFEIIETMPDGKTVRKMIDPDGYTSDKPATLDPKTPVTFQGKVTGDATFEITAIPERGAVSLTGRILDKGSLKNPLSLAISIVFEPYRYNNDQQTPEQKEKFEKKAKRDEIRLVLAKGEKSKIEFLDEANPAETAKAGFTSAEIRTEAYDALGFEITASEKSTLTFADKGAKPLWNGFTISWAVNEGADPTTQKLTIATK